MKSAVLRAESRLGIEVPEDLLEKARRLTDQKMKVKGLERTRAAHGLHLQALW